MENQFQTPTSRPRREGVCGHQIDFVAVKHVHAENVTVHVDSFMSIDGDHDFVSTLVATNRRRQKRERVDTRPQRVVGHIPPQTELTQTTLRPCRDLHQAGPKQGVP